MRQPADAGTNHKQNVLVIPDAADVNSKYFSFGGGNPEYGGDVATANQHNPYASEVANIHHDRHQTSSSADLHSSMVESVHPVN